MRHINLSKLKKTGVSHNPSIKKKNILEKGFIPGLMMYSEATFQPNQTVDPHKHDTMFEVYYIKSGSAEITINNKKINAKREDVVVVEPGEIHSVKNISNKPFTWLYFGIATD